MHLEQPHHPPAGIGAFLRQYAMIVLSILTALGLEHVAVSAQNTGAARASRTRIEAELASNAADLRHAIAATEASTKDVAALLKSLVDLLKAGKPVDASVTAQFPSVFSHFTVTVMSWQRNAWDCAIADQSASHLAPADLRRYAEIYAAAADVNSLAQLMLGGEWLTRASDQNIDIRLGRIDSRTLASTLARFLLAGRQITNSENDLLVLIEKDGGAAAAVRAAER